MGKASFTSFLVFNQKGRILGACWLASSLLVTRCLAISWVAASESLSEPPLTWCEVKAPMEMQKKRRRTSLSDWHPSFILSVVQDGYQLNKQNRIRTESSFILVVKLYNFVICVLCAQKKLVMPTKCNSCTFGLEYMQTTGSSITTTLVFGSQRRRHHSCVPFIAALRAWIMNYGVFKLLFPAV